MASVRITPLEKVSENERGANFGLKTRLRDDYMVIFRKKGTVNGNHHHVGKNQAKNPEVIIFLDGQALFEWREPASGELAKTELKAPTKIEVWPNVWHRLTAKTDIVFIEEGLLKPEEYEEETVRS
jgi:dTDP-4-dehydrorhamnose 3,5-epimerase-like enzyme